MSFASCLKETARGGGAARDLAPEEAQRLFAAMLDGGVPELELGALLVALRMKGESIGELLGFYRALAERVHQLAPPEIGLRTVVFGTYEGACTQPNLTPLVALLLRRMGVSALVHGTLEGHGCVASAYILRELGVLPCVTLTQAQERLRSEKLAFVPTAVLAPGLARLLALRSRLGGGTIADSVAKLIDPFPGRSLRLVGGSSSGELARLREIFFATGERAIVFRDTEGEPYADPRQRPRIEYLELGGAEVLFAEEHALQDPLTGSPDTVHAKATASYIRNALEGVVPLPLPIVHQIACCLYGAGLAADLNQAKALTAVQAHALMA